MRNRHRRGCGCHQERHNRWIEPSILFLLWDEKKHGYELMSQIPEIGFMQGNPDPGAIYRTLRHLEESELVLSEWDTSGSGPAKRIYSLTELGRDHLQLWSESLQQRRDALNAFLQKVDNLS